MTTKNRIFLAHVSEDKPQVRQLYDQLKAKGFSPWLDAVDLIPGQNWREEIPKAIREATICLACLSKRSLAKRSYVQKEFRYAMSAYAELPPGSIYLIPVRLDDCEVPDFQLAELDLKLADLHWVDLFEDGGFKKLVAAIELNAKTKPNRPKAFRDIDAAWCPEMVMIPAGTFMMGSPEDETERECQEGPQHEVTISQPFALGRCAVTFEEYDYFCDKVGLKKPDDQGWGRAQRPVINVSYHDAVAYCAWLSRATASAYRLPTEAEWEYACRAGTTTRFSFGENISTACVNFDGRKGSKRYRPGQYRQQTVAVGSLPANAWGFHEMHGNVWEWCADGRRDYDAAAVTDPQARPSISCMVRGGSWIDNEQFLRAAFRFDQVLDHRYYSFGFRCARIS